MRVDNQADEQGQSDEKRKITSGAVTLVYPSWVMRNALASLINLVTLLIGMGIGIALAPHVNRPVKAASQTPPASSGTAIQPPKALESQSVEQIQPTLTAGSVGSYLLLAHHIQSDELVVNGYDVMKLENAQLQLLSRFIPESEVQSAVNGAKTDHLYQVKPQTPPSSPKK